VKSRAIIIACVAFIASGLLTLVVGVTATVEIGRLTGSGLMGICGPYGDYSGLMICMFLGSFPASLVVGSFSAVYFYRHISENEPEN
jgi:hypothetical protein